MNDTQRLLLYLLSCAVNGIVPDRTRVQSADADRLFSLAKDHSLSGAVCIALKTTGIEDERFVQSYIKAVRKNIFFDVEREAILAAFERQGIWYLPLKGSVIKNLYPKNGMREMADNDILFNPAMSKQVRDIMLSRGYEVKSFGRWHHDVYTKPPVLNFEMHSALFYQSENDPIFQYYSDVKRLLKKDEGNGYGYHFSDEDFYVYMTTHEWRHYSDCGTGLRSLLDCYVYCTVKGDSLDWPYIEEQCQRLGTAGYEKERRMLAMKIFSSDALPELTETEADLLTRYLTAGTYGSMENEIDKKLMTQSKTGYLLRQIFPDLHYMKHSVTFVRKYPLLYPAGIVYRWGRILLCRRQQLRKTISIVTRHGK